MQYNLNGYSLANGLFGVWNSLGTVLFAYGGHNVVLEIQVRLPGLLPAFGSFVSLNPKKRLLL